MTSTGLRGRVFAFAIGLVIVGALVVATVVDNDERGDDQTAMTTPVVSACLAVSGPSTSAGYEEVDCAATGATYQVTAADAVCDQDAELTYRLDGVADAPGVVLCLDLNAAVGDCFRLAAGADLAHKLDCTDEVDDPAIVQVRTVGAAGTACPADTQPRENRTRGELLCLAARP